VNEFLQIGCTVLRNFSHN